ncbi:flagellar basal body rod protein FlgB [Domibacillus epiphyticus]|uniref:Flagellar basal body rod protein FlgB n=1 Tax=Domibacillus epiphyticus TaxID=1714355 RepID=A0A1V2AC78_9BACI|nr:flagellar basal body rod protein FlgB [Domibacillus epiphyticus]OMP68595.1 flagellar basal body rod protein FlgB [Domibacillus epiphyticus]
MKLFSDSITSLERGLDYAALKQKTIADNIANVDTPNYKSREVSFKRILSNAGETLAANRTDQRHFEFSASSDGTIIAKRNLTYNESGNNVDIDQEMSDLAKNQIYYNALTDRLSSKFSSLTNVIKGGR